MSAETTTEAKPVNKRGTRRRNVNGSTDNNPVVEAAMSGLVDETTPDAKSLDLDAIGPNLGEIEKLPQVDTAPPQDDKPSKELTQTLTPAHVPPPRLSKDEKEAIKEAEKQARQNQSPSTKRLGAIGQLLPGAERVRISKRKDNGLKAYIGEYGLRDLQGSGTLDAFVNKYLKPHYGPGEYPIEGITAHGGIVECQSVYIMEPITDAVPQPPGGTDSAVVDLLRQQLNVDRERQQSDTERLLQGISNMLQPQRQQDPIESMQKLYQFQQEINPPKPEDNSLGAVMTAMAQMNQANMQMMMGMFGSIVQTLGQKQTDPVLGAILASLLEKKKDSGDAMPPMPMPSPPNPTQSLRELAEVIAILKGGGDDNDKFTNYLLQERMTPKDVLQLVNEVKGERGTDDLKKSLENLGIMMNAVQTLRSNTEPGGGGWAEAITALFQNPSLGRIATSAMGGRQAAALPANGEQQSDADFQARARALQERRMRIEEKRLAIAEQQITEAERPGRAPHQPFVPQPQKQVTSGEVQQPKQPLQHNVQTLPQFPEGIVDYVNELLGAEDDSERIQAFLHMLQFLNDHKEWKQLAQTILHFLLQGDADQSMPFIRTFLNSLQAINFIDEESAILTAAAMEHNFDEVVGNVRQLADSMDDETADADDDAGFRELSEAADILGEGEDEEEDFEENDDEDE